MKLYLLWTLPLLASADSCGALPAERNAALYGRPTQSSVLELGQAINAVDGNAEADPLKGSCSSTRLQHAPWWRVDLLAEHNVSTVRVTGRGCPNSRAWLARAQVRVGSRRAHDRNPLCGELVVDQVTQELCCQGMQGRFVSISLYNVNSILSLCEVEVLAVPAGQESCL
ncbi:fucolectin-4-like [Amia ocellicauda]|uniref:fucolectin-4-like n=1 Tax=Amia ocellicauda TaxID=2972642 RepID=UPI00346410B8